MDEAARTVQTWLAEAGAKHKDVLRIRLTVEELLEKVLAQGEDGLQAELSFSRWVGAGLLRIRYGGAPFDPTQSGESEMEDLSSSIMARIGLRPVWRKRGDGSELLFRIPLPGLRPEYVMLGCIVLALGAGLAGGWLPEGVKAGATEYGLAFLADGFLNLLNTFVGLMLFLSIVTGICGVGSASSFGRMGKLMLSRFIALSFLISGLLVIAARFLFHIAGDAGSGASQVHSILQMVFGILPTNPVRPFLEGNNLQIVFMGVFVGVIFLVTENEDGLLRRIMSRALDVVMKCVSVVCMFLPLYIFASLVMQIWESGAGMFLALWKPLTVCAGCTLAVMGCYLAIVCVKLKVKPGVLLLKLLPDYLIGLSTASSSAAFASALETNDEKLGIAPFFSRTAVPIGTMLSEGVCSLLYTITCMYVAERYGVSADFAWWITLWIAGTLLAMATPPVAGGGVSCLSIMLLQLHLPAEGLAVGVALVMLLDFLCTGAHIFVLHLELTLQADRLGLLNRETLQRKS